MPAYIAVGVLLYFILFFREKKQIRIAGEVLEPAMKEMKQP
jgi:hypothetical protein